MQIEPTPLFTSFDEIGPLIAVMFGILGVALPAITFGCARKVLNVNEQYFVPAIISAAVVSITGLVVGAGIILAIIGWLPTPLQFM